MNPLLLNIEDYSSTLLSIIDSAVLQRMQEKRIFAKLDQHSIKIAFRDRCLLLINVESTIVSLLMLMFIANKWGTRT